MSFDWKILNVEQLERGFGITIEITVLVLGHAIVTTQRKFFSINLPDVSA